MPKNIATKEMELAWANAVSDNAETAVNSVISSDSSEDIMSEIVAKCGACGGGCGGGGQEVKGVEVDYGQIPSVACHVFDERYQRMQTICIKINDALDNEDQY